MCASLPLSPPRPPHAHSVWYSRGEGAPRLAAKVVGEAQPGSGLFTVMAEGKRVQAAVADLTVMDAGGGSLNPASATVDVVPAAAAPVAVPDAVAAAVVAVPREGQPDAAKASERDRRGKDKERERGKKETRRSRSRSRGKEDARRSRSRGREEKEKQGRRSRSRSRDAKANRRSRSRSRGRITSVNR